MPNAYTEADYENSVMELFGGLGYDIVYGPDIERDQRSPLYDEVLEDYLRRLNAKLPEDALADALYKLRNFENGELGFRAMKSLWIICKMAFLCAIRSKGKNAQILLIWWIIRIRLTIRLLRLISGHISRTAKSVLMWCCFSMACRWWLLS